MAQRYRMITCPVTSGTWVRIYKEAKDMDSRPYWTETMSFMADWQTDVKLKGAEFFQLLNAAQQGRIETEAKG